MLKEGDRFGDYAVVRRLGKGGMGEVWLLRAPSGVEVAAKILNPETAHDGESRRRFLREAELAMGVKHPNLVETYDVGEDPETGLCYILMEFVPGGSLSDRIRRDGPLPVGDALSIVYQVASVLELARQKGIVHRDIKPDNIMFGADGKAKLADLGIARCRLGAETMTVTQTGTMMGTPAYMAPEQMLDSHHVDCRADIYSLGVVLYEMLTGTRPNKDDTIVELMAKAMQGVPIPDVRRQRPEVSASVAGLVGLMCAMDVDERASTPLEVTTAVSQIVHGREVTIRKKRPQLPPKPARANRARTAVPFVLLALGGLAFGSWFLLGRSPKAVPTPRSEVARPVGTNAPTAAVARTDPADVQPLPAKVARADRPVRQPEAVRNVVAVATGGVRVASASAVTNVPSANPEPFVPKVVPTGDPLALSLGGDVTLTLVRCPPGSFTMGYADSDRPVDRPHRVAITRQFWIGKVPVTVAQWQRLMGEYRLKDRDRVFGHLDLAVGRVSDDRMLTFCRLLTERFGRLLPKGYVFRFPTDAEWEYACKAGSDDPRDPYVRYRFASFSQETLVAVKIQDMLKFFEAKGFPDAQNFKYDILWPVGTKRPNRWGIRDMIGLGAELVADTYSRFDTRTGLPRNQAGIVTDCDLPPEAEDPISICGEAEAVRLVRSSEFRGVAAAGAGRRWHVRNHCAGIETFRVAAGPDLEREKAGADAAPSARPAVERTGKPTVPKQGKPLSLALGKGVTLEMLHCPAGSFTMGWDCGKPAFEPHAVKLSRPFWAGKYPATRAQWNRFMRPQTMTEQERVLGGGAEGANAAVPGASREAIDEFCQQLTRKFRRQLPKGYVFRLPTMAEHEYIWRAGGTVPDGLYGRPEISSPDERARFGLGNAGKSRLLSAAGCDLTDDEWKVPAKRPVSEVGLGAANPWGFFDLSGNGDQWLLDTFPVGNLGETKGLWSVSHVGRLPWAEQPVDPLFWCDDDNAAHMLLGTSACVAWGHAAKVYMTHVAHFRCLIFRLVIGPDLVREKKTGRFRNKSVRPSDRKKN